MARVPVMEEQQLQDMISIAAVTGQLSARDAALLSVPMEPAFSWLNLSAFR
jgi:hypothetical protein